MGTNLKTRLESSKSEVLLANKYLYTSIEFEFFITDNPAES